MRRAWFLMGLQYLDAPKKMHAIITTAIACKYTERITCKQYIDIMPVSSDAFHAAQHQDARALDIIMFLELLSSVFSCEQKEATWGHFIFAFSVMNTISLLGNKNVFAREVTVKHWHWEYYGKYSWTCFILLHMFHSVNITRHKFQWIEHMARTWSCTLRETASWSTRMWTYVCIYMHALVIILIHIPCVEQIWASTGLSWF